MSDRTEVKKKLKNHLNMSSERCTITLQSYKTNILLAEKVSTSKKIDGPFEDDFDKSDTAGVFSQAWSPCGFNVPLNMKTTLTLTGSSNDPAIMTVDQITGMLTQLFHIKWKECD